ncbi:hypothetical protein GCM10018793_41870 [Streptomyces sulfonofaciens]|uniref:DUF2255 family protein n=1 Tax=Streptomyces sulfonofaciens TaxID=68272 RepID=A0A919GD07_9ACTN|nr:DUF2255 family protein [Streptomyces sulfonofaciens]GHH82328.1 hypothetical protein GCM10018793_41870 [Streptomyces sulfonofaciens]
MHDGSWDSDDLEDFRGSDEILLRVRRVDGGLDEARPVWVVEAGGNVFVRGYRGPDSAWYRRARASGEGMVRTGDRWRPVRFTPAAAEVTRSDIDDAYRSKYARSGYVSALLEEGPASATLRLDAAAGPPGPAAA